MDTDKTLQVNKNIEKQAQSLQQEQQILQEQQSDSISKDWVNVGSERFTDTQMLKIKYSEEVNVNEPEAQRAMKDLLLYEPVRLTKDELKDVSRDEVRQDRAVKVADLKNFDLNQLTDWALCNAKARGADSSFIKLVENLLNIRALANDMVTVTSEEAVIECRKQFETVVDSLSDNVTSYYDSHNKFIVFSEKGRLRLEFCRVLRTKMSGGLLNTLKSKADFDEASQVMRLKRQEEEGLKDGISRDYNLESDEFYQGIRQTVEKQNGDFLALRESNKDVETFEKDSVVGISQLERKQLAQLFKFTGTGAEEWNEKVLEAIKKYNESKDDSALDGIVEDMIKEVCDFKLTPEMVSNDYCNKHPEFYIKLYRMGMIFGDFQDVGSFKNFPGSFKRVLEKDPALKAKFDILGQCISDYLNRQTTIFGTAYGMDLNKLMGGKTHYKELGQESEESGKELLDSLEEDNRETIDKYQLMTALCKDLDSRSYYYGKHYENFKKLGGVKSEDYNRALGQSILLIERDKQGNPLEEDRENSEINDKYINSLLNGNVEECAEACYELIDYAMKVKDVLLNIETDFDKYRENCKIYHSCQGQFLNLLSISFGPKKKFIEFIKSENAPEGVKKLIEEYKKLGDIGKFQNQILKNKFEEYGIVMESGQKIKKKDYSNDKTMKAAVDIHSEMLEEYREKHKPGETVSYISKEEFMNAFREFLKNQSESSENEKQKS